MRVGRNVARKLERLRPLWQTLSPRRRRQILELQVLSLAAALAEVANLAALLPFLRLLANPLEGLSALGPVAAPLRMLPPSSLLLCLGLGFMAVVVVSTLIRVFTIRRQLHLAALITSDLGVQVLSAVLHKPFAWHLQHNSSGVLSNLTKDVEQVFVMIQALLMLAVNVVIVVLLGGALLSLAPGLMLLIGALLAGFYLLVFRYTRGELRRDGERYTSHYQTSLQVVQEALGGIRDVILDRSQPFFLTAYRGGNHTYLMAGAAINTKAQVPRYLIEGFAVMLIVALSLTLSLAGQGIERQLPLLGTLSLGAYRLLQPLQQCFIALSNLQANQPSLLRLEPFLGVQNPAPTRPGATLSWPSPPSPHTPLVELNDVGFRYGPDSPWVLHHLHLRIAPGERIAFVGSTGSGKSTTSDLILGLLAPNQGKVLVWGQDLHGSPDLVKAWQERVAHVPQQIYLSDASFAANIAFGIPEAQIDLNRVQHAARQARIADLIEHSPLGYGTVVGERGVRLSGGQRQRIGIARALYKQAELLVLDEATSALDNRTEAEVMEAIEALDRAITVILIAHRLSTVKHCDSIVMLERGMISGVGTFSELLSNHSGFQSLARQREWSAS